MIATDMFTPAFSAALLDPALAVPAGLTGPDGRAAGRRFSVYRNNVAVGLTDALRAGFPVVLKLVGDEFFAAMAGVFLRAHPPRSPLIMLYGAEFADFVAAFPPAAGLPYLADVARLEQALRQSYHAADNDPPDPGLLNGLAPERLLAMGLRLAPATAVLRSAWPVHAIWQANMHAIPLPRDLGPQDVLITRPAFDPVPERLPPGGAAIIAALQAGAALADAHAASPDADLGAIFTLLLRTNAIAALTEAR